ncbi:hypothetical protein JA1_002560 [Spathaspora sp. JA1]|nr:hypothetical protein JA1_002560 [Spathaspora sp. JA1]
MEFVLDLIAERSVIRESLKGIIWTIFFNRLFGPITPSTSEFLNITYPVAINLPDLDSSIDERINQLVKTRFDKNNHRGIINIQFLDKDRHAASKKKTGWFGRENQPGESLKCWESWLINIECLPIDEIPEKHPATPPPPPPEHHTDDNKYSVNIVESIKSFELNLIKIIDIVDKHKSHIPPITSLESSPFPYKMIITPPETEVSTTSAAATTTTTAVSTISETSSSSSSNLKSDTTDEGWGNYIKKML